MKITYQLISPMNGKTRTVTTLQPEALASYLRIPVWDIQVGEYPDDGVTVLSIELTDADLDHVTGGIRPSPDAGCRYAPMGGRCYPAGGVNWPLSLRAQRVARYGDK